MYPKLVARVFYDAQILFDYIDVANTQYEIKIYVQTDETTLVEIPTSDANLIYRSHSYNVDYRVDGTKRYLYPKTVGAFNYEIQYFYDEQYLRLEGTYNIYRKNTFPKLVGRPYIGIEEQPKFLDINSQYTLKTYIMFEDGIEIETPQILTSLIMADQNITYTIESGKFVLHTSEIGTCKVNIYFTYCGADIFSSEEILVYEPFFRDNYALHMLTQFDLANMQNNKKMKALFDTLMEFLDMLYAYYNDIKYTNNIGELKSRYLALAGISRGFEKTNIYEGNSLEWVYEKLYRELLNNLVDLLQLRGTKLSYELFFGALGYDIDLLEFWFDKDGNLIEINYEDELNSTFFAYDVEGNPLEDIQVPHIDPRKDISPTNEYNYVSKSKYIKAIISAKEGVYNPLAFSNEQQVLIQKYLDWLRPNHIEYLQNVFKMNLTQGESVTGEEIIMPEDSVSGFSTASLEELVGFYIDMSGMYNALTPLGYIPTQPTGYPYWIPPAGLMSNVEHTYFGAWYYDPLVDVEPYRNVRGLCIEHLRMPTDEIIIGDGLEFSELLDIPVIYDSIYDYDADSMPQPPPAPYVDSVGLRYDVGRLLYDSDLEVIDLNVFDQMYDDYILTHTMDETVEYLAAYFDITEERCQNIIASL